MKRYFFCLCMMIFSFFVNGSSSEGSNLKEARSTDSTTATIVSKDVPNILKKENEKIIDNENNRNDIDFFAHINEHIAPLKADFKNYVVPACAKISSTASIIVAIVNQIGYSNSGIVISPWAQTLTNGLTFVANIAWLIQHAGDKNQVKLFLNKTNNVVDQN